MNELRDAVFAVYLQYDESADAIICDPDLAVRFAEKVNGLVCPALRQATRDIMRCLLNMRKRGALPLKHRIVYD